MRSLTVILKIRISYIIFSFRVYFNIISLVFPLYYKLNLCFVSDSILQCIMNCATYIYDEILPAYCQHHVFIIGYHIRNITMLYLPISMPDKHGSICILIKFIITVIVLLCSELVPELAFFAFIPKVN